VKKKYLGINLSEIISFIDLILTPIKLIFISVYLISKKPFSPGYNFYKWKIIKDKINKFKININTQKKEVGYGLDERIVEYPWVIRELRKYKGKLLDAGSTLNFPEILDILKNKYRITIQTLYPENYCNFENGVSYIYEDITKQIFNKNQFDVITCISTLEHIGFDISIYNENNKKKIVNSVNDYLKAIENFNLILKKNGVLLITIPYGKYQKFNDLQQFDKKMLNLIINKFKPKKYSLIFSIYKNRKWQICNQDDCDNIMFKHFSEKNSIDNAASARSIAMIKLTKK
jgi:hypothetical protein